MEWNKVRLGDYVSIKSGLAYKGSLIGKGESLLLGMGCVSFKDKFVETGARLYDDKSDDRFVVKPGDIVLATRQQSDNLPILAMPAIIPEKFEGKRVIFGTNLYKVDNNSEIDNRFLFWLLKHQHYVNYIAGVKSGTAVQMVTKKNVEDYKFDCPPKPIRDKIANILWTYDTLIENNTKRIRLLEQMAENLYKEWFVRFRFPGHENVEMENGLPKGWKVERLEKILEIKYGKDHKHLEDGNIPILGSGGIMRYGSKSLYTGESVLIPRKGTLNNIMYRDDSFWTVDTMFYTIPKIENVCKYMYYVLSAINMESMNPGAALPSMTTNILNRLKIILPHKEILERFNNTISSLYCEIKNLQTQSHLLTRQRDLLLPRLMSGKLEVKA